MLGLGFGFVEVGTVTPRPQAGQSQAAAVPAARGPGGDQPHGLQQSRAGSGVRAAAKRDRAHGIVGVNIGANKDSADRIADYVAGVRAMAPVARLSDDQHQLAQHAGPARLAGRGRARRVAGGGAGSAAGGGPPVFLKVAPDLGEGDPERIVRAAIDHGIDALIVANTTVSRPPLKSRHAIEAGGLSGEPLKPLALEALRRFRSGQRRRKSR